MKRGYGEKLLVGGDSVTLTSNLLACVRRVGSSEQTISAVSPKYNLSVGCDSTFAA